MHVRERLREIKIQRGCADCGFRRCATALEFHHRPGTVKLFALGSQAAFDKSWARLNAEMEKCDVLCANCHRMRECACCV